MLHYADFKCDCPILAQFLPRHCVVSRNIKGRSTGYKYPWPFILKEPNPIESGDPRYETPGFREKIDAAYKKHVASEEAQLREKEQFHKNLKEIEAAFKGYSATLDAEMLEAMAAEKARPHSWELTPEIRKIAHDFSVAWHEFRSLESIALGFSSTDLSLDALKPYQLTEPGSSYKVSSLSHNLHFFECSVV